MKGKILVLECAGLDLGVVAKSHRLSQLMSFQRLTPVFPAVTCVEQATMRTGLHPSQHGIVCNGRYDRASCKTEFWGQSARLYRGERMWTGVADIQTAVMFMQQSLGDREVQYCISPAPIHKHHGGIIMGCHTVPAELEAELTAAAGKPFRLSSYWGPMANGESSRWIASATLEVLRRYSPALVYSYLPHLDYVLQREGPEGEHVHIEAELLADLLSRLLEGARALGYEVLVWGDYAVTQARQVVYPNKALRAAGLFRTRQVGKRLYPDLYDSSCLALTDHQVAHVYVQHPGDRGKAYDLLSRLPGVDSVLSCEEAGFARQDGGDWVVTASQGSWFSYRWWEHASEAPDYASHVDIHNKMGFDPCELFWSLPFLSISQDDTRVKGTHGRTDTLAAFAVTAGLEELVQASTTLELAQALKEKIRE